MRRHEGMKASNNLHGFRGVEYRSDRKQYRARICPENGKRRWLGSFETPELAAAAYDEAAREAYGADAYLNFPREGENKAVQHSREDGNCINGHNLSQQGYERADGRGYNCRACGLEASARYYRRQTQNTD